MSQMSNDNTTYLEVGTHRIACLTTPGTRTDVPGLLWLSGFNSSMNGTKATDLASWSGENGIAMTRFDYSGHGRSSGKFEDGNISIWLEETRAVLDQMATGPQILIGSSMGGWLALLLAGELNTKAPGRIAGLVLIAPAWDMTERLMWDTASPDVRHEMQTKGVWYRPSQYDDDNYPITMQLIEDGRKHLLGDGPVDTGCPVRILHGMADPDVPWQGSETLIERLATGDARLTLVKGAGHRLSEPEDIRLLKGVISGLVHIGA
ncbi:MAG: alpha/beta hydrolase [Hyphomicrobiaceae bacterium]